MKKSFLKNVFFEKKSFLKKKFFEKKSFLKNRFFEKNVFFKKIIAAVQLLQLNPSADGAEIHSIRFRAII